MIKRLFFITSIFLLVPLMAISQAEEIAKQADSIQTNVEEITLQKETEKIEKETPTQKCVEGDCENGKGTMYYESGTYMGNWKDGLRHGVGKFVWNNGDMYDGEWDEDLRHGSGVYKWHDGSEYKGNYSFGVRSGYGIYYYANGNIYEGTWQNNLKHGIANFYYEGSVNIGGKYVDNKYVSGTGITQEDYKFKPNNM